MPLHYHSRKYTLNEDFFTNWSQEMAYVLGFWFADGYMRHDKSYRISLTSNDVDHLKLVNTTLGSNSPLVNQKGEIAYNLLVRSKKLYEKLLELGGIRAKSRILVFPYIPDRYLADFIRGYFDGDGSVHKISYKATKNGKIYSEIRSNFTCGSKKFLLSLRGILVNKIGVAPRAIGQFGPYQFKLGFGQRDTFKLLRYLYYPGHILSLNRKARYLEFAA